MEMKSRFRAGDQVCTQADLNKIYPFYHSSEMIACVDKVATIINVEYWRLTQCYIYKLDILPGFWWSEGMLMEL